MIQKFHLGVYCLIFSSNDEIVLVKKARGAYTGMLDLPGGSIEFGENVEQALMREIREETGLFVNDFEISSAQSVNFKYQQSGSEHHLFHIGIIYEATLEEATQLAPTIKDLDVSTAAWYKISDLNTQNITPMVVQALVKSIGNRRI